MQPRFCSYCGAALPEGAAFCPACQQPVSSQPVVHYYVKQKVPGRGFGISSMVLGIFAVVYCPILLLNFFSDVPRMGTYIVSAILPSIIVFAVFPILSTVFSCVARTRGYRNGVSTSGLTMGIIGLACSVFSLLLAILYSI